MSHCQYAHELLHLFVSQSGQLCGRDVLVYNVHDLIHLAADVQNVGPLDSYSAFLFENFLGKLKTLVCKPNLPLQQFIRRLSEKRNQINKCQENNRATFLRNVIIWDQSYVSLHSIHLSCNFKDIDATDASLGVIVH